MALTKYKLGELIKLIDERNSEGIRNFYGVNINKEFMPTVADTSNLNEKNYKVVRKNRFACNLMHVGRDVTIPVALYQESDPIIVSPAYFTFEVSATDNICLCFFNRRKKIAWVGFIVTVVFAQIWLGVILLT